MTITTPDLSGKLVLVTGATRGIGRAVAIAAASAGAELVITGRTIGALEEVDDEIKAGGGHATIVEMDMQDTAAMPRLAAAIAERWGRLDGFVANAAILTALTPVGHVTPEDWETNIAVNLTGQWHMIRAFDPLLRAAPAGRAILVTSGAAVGSRPFWGPYAATKAGLEALGRSWAGESEQTDIRINMMNPGGTATTMRASAFPGEDPASLPQPADIAPAFLALLAEDCPWHGEVVNAREIAGL
ncbi:MAG: SDR family NAD(P)-dependent oxidoreductase [Alphaproteobacteria bacterium]|jgi:NAD(P)-dependent dehydrogenase (short-subunit alcohol dehydrogenase family)|nr:SDR family NAD(P)-dependent oxidoreductase [Alphaproteobacteria bacterium]